MAPFKKHIITISGKPGSGKSTTSKRLAEALGYLHFSAGDFFRAIGKERGFDVLATNFLAEQEKTIDEEVDKKLRELGEKENQMIIDSRMAWHWMPYSFRVYLDLDLTTAATRILSKTDSIRRAAEFIPDSPELYAKTLQDRLDSETKRYLNLYNADPYNISNYDLVVDTAKYNPDAVQKIILESYAAWTAGV